MSSLFGFEVGSELELNRLNAAPGSRGRISVALARSDPLAAVGTLTSFSEANDTTFALAVREDGAVVAACGATGDWLIDPAEGRIEVRPAQDVDAAAVEHRLVSVMVPLLLAERGDLVIHASAIQTPAGAVLFAGPSGRGKSATVASLHEAGHQVLAEDGLAIELAGEGPRAWAGARGIRLKGAQRPGLVPTADTAGATGLPVAAVVALGRRAGEPSLRALSPSEAAALLAPNLFHRGGPDGLRPAFRSLAALTAAAPGYLAALPDDLARLPQASAELVGAVTPS